MTRPTNTPAGTGTRAVRASIESDTQHGAVVPPLYLSSNYAFRGLGDKRPYDYTRSGNPTRDSLGDALCDLEGGAGAVVTASGMGALNVLVQLLKPGDLLLAPHDCYGGTYRLYEALARKGHFNVEFVDQTDADALDAACARGPRLILSETPSNPLLRIVDIRAVADRARACGALFAVDNTFLSPASQQPISLGADVVIHSTTKYINGHSDVVGGALIAADAAVAEELAWWANCIGATGAPFDSFLTLRGLRTLGVRIRQHEATAGMIAQLLTEQTGVRSVNYPGLATHPGHAIACKQQSGFGGMVSFEIAGGEVAVKRFVESLELFSLAESLGGVESLVCHPPTMTHAPVAAEALAEAGISQNLVRLSIGLEEPEDLAGDILRALEAAAEAPQTIRPITPVCAA
jgi:cystathionine gamma-synthase